jgi:hypothetical protein
MDYVHVTCERPVLAIFSECISAYYCYLLQGICVLKIADGEMRLNQTLSNVS